MRKGLIFCKACRFYPQDSEEALMGFEQGRDMVRMYLRVITLASEQRTEWREERGKDREQLGDFESPRLPWQLIS